MTWGFKLEKKIYNTIYIYIYIYILNVMFHEQPYSLPTLYDRDIFDGNIT
jgi:hypothetical protein